MRHLSLLVVVFSIVFLGWTAAACAAPFAYVHSTNPRSENTVSVIDTATDTVTAVIPGIGLAPYGVAVHPDGTRVYVANQYGGGTLSVIDATINTVVATVPMGEWGPWFVTAHPDGTRVYVSISNGYKIKVVNTATNTVVGTIGTRGVPADMVVHPDGTRLYVGTSIPSGVSGFVTVIDTATNAIIAEVPAGSDATCMAITPDGTRVYVTSACEGNNTVSVIDTATNTVVAGIGTADERPFGVAVHPDGTRLYITTCSNNILVADTATNTLVATIPVISAGGIAVHPDGTRLYVPAGVHGVLVIDTATNTVVRTVPTVGAVDAVGQFISPSVSPPIATAQWHMDEGSGNIMHDSSGNSNDGTIQGATWTDGISEKGLYFDGIDDNIVVPGGILNTLRSGTMVFWIKLADRIDSTSEARMLFTSVQQYVNSQIFLGFQGKYNLGKMIFRKSSAFDVTTDLYSNTDVWEANTWYQIVITWSGSNMSLFINGELDNSTENAVVGMLSGANLAVIGAMELKHSFFKGIIDEVVIYSRALTAEEIQQHYQEKRLPLADAGADQTVHVGETVTLDGSKSVDFGGHYPLSYFWEITSKPEGSAVLLSDSTAVNPTFIPDITGDYIISLVVTNSIGSRSEQDEVKVSTYNSAPVANPGEGVTTHPGEGVTLDGTGSSDIDGDILSYQWSIISKPEGSNATLLDSHTATPTLMPDIPGDYVLQLIVTDAWGAVSEPVTVTISTTNTAPVADAGMDQSIIVIGTQVQLNGSHSYDIDGDNISYTWNITTRPEGSTTVLDNSASATPSFIADVHGTYVIQLVVSDPWTQSPPDTVIVSFENVAPVANAGNNQSVVQADTVYLDGSGSSDANKDPFIFKWSILSKPSDSQAELNDSTSPAPYFVADKPGTYIVQLIVNDGYVNSEPSTVSILAVSFQDETTRTLQETIEAINTLSDADLTNSNLQKALTNKIIAVIEKIQAGEYQEAIDKLTHDIMKKTDGCVLEGTPDKNDWIITCVAQSSVYPLLERAVSLLNNLI